MNKVFIRQYRISVSVFLFLAIFSIIHYVKPALIYTKEGAFREFGVGYRNKTVLPIWVFAIVLSILSYLAVSWFIMLG